LVQSSTGEVADLDAAREAARRVGALVVVDATQALGWLPVDLDGVDALVASAYKWLLAPRGAAILATSERLRERMVPLYANWYAGDPIPASLYGPRSGSRPPLAASTPPRPGSPGSAPFPRLSCCSLSASTRSGPTTPSSPARCAIYSAFANLGARAPSSPSPWRRRPSSSRPACRCAMGECASPSTSTTTSPTSRGSPSACGLSACARPTLTSQRAGSAKAPQRTSRCQPSHAQLIQSSPRASREVRSLRTRVAGPAPHRSASTQTAIARATMLQAMTITAPPATNQARPTRA
jgi:hypothetical protein